MTHHNIINANKIIINYGNPDKQKSSISTNRKFLQSREGGRSINTDGTYHNITSTTQERALMDQFDDQMDNDEEVMFVGKKINTNKEKAMKTLPAQRKVNRSVPNKGRFTNINPNMVMRATLNPSHN